MTFGDNVAALEADGDFHHLMSELIRSHRLGRHLFVADRASVDWLLSTLRLSALEEATLNRIRQSFTQNGALHLQAKRYVEIDFSFPVASEVGAKISVPWKVLARMDLSLPATLLVENIDNDRWFYKNILDFVKRRYNIPRMDIEFSNGGGGSIGSSFEYLTGRRRIVVALVDSDKKSPNSSLGSTAKSLHGVQADFKWTLCYVAILPCKEIENLLPLEICLEHPECKVHPTNKLLSDVWLNESDNKIDLLDRFSTFFDFKDGYNVEKFNAWTQSDKDWVEAKLKIANADLASDITGYGARPISHLKTSSKSQEHFRSFMKSELWKNCYDEFFAPIGWTFAASEPLRT